jgi:hypothetical protein
MVMVGLGAVVVQVTSLVLVTVSGGWVWVTVRGGAVTLTVVVTGGAVTVMVWVISTGTVVSATVRIFLSTDQGLVAPSSPTALTLQ